MIGLTITNTVDVRRDIWKARGGHLDAEAVASLRLALSIPHLLVQSLFERGSPPNEDSPLYQLLREGRIAEYLPFATQCSCAIEPWSGGYQVKVGISCEGQELGKATVVITQGRVSCVTALD